MERAKKRSEALARLIIRSFEEEEIPERIYRRCEGLLSLQRKTHPVVFERACVYALESGLLGYKSLQRIIENRAYELVQSDKQREEQEERPLHQNIRVSNII